MTTNETTPRSRWRVRGRQRPALDVIVTDDAPLAQITIYDAITLLNRRCGDGWRQYPISADGLAQVLGRLPSASGLLPPHTLGTGLINGLPFYVVYVPPARRTLRTEARDYDIPLPPLIWAGWQTEYRVWALDTLDYPANGAVTLMRAPFPNCYTSGAICWGSSDVRQLAAPTTLPHMLKLFLEDSYFNLHVADGKSVRFPNSVLAHWKALVEDGVAAYPLADLMPAEYQLGWLLDGGPWKSGGRG